MKTRSPLVALAAALLFACDAAEDVRVQELPALARSSLEARLGLAEVRGPWRFAGWELAEGDTLGLEAELPGLGALWLQTQKRDSIAGLYLTAGGGRAPLVGEVRRDSVLALVAFPQPEDGRYLVGTVRADTIWLESTTLVEPGSWREDARAAFVRSQAAITPFRRVRGVLAAGPPVDSAALAAGTDSIAPPAPGSIPGISPGAGIPAPATATRPPATPGRTGAPPTTEPATTPRAEAPPAAAPPSTRPVPTESTGEEQAEAEAPVPLPEREPAPVVERRDPPRVLGEPVVRDTAGGNQLP